MKLENLLLGLGQRECRCNSTVSARALLNARSHGLQLRGGVVVRLVVVLDRYVQPVIQCGNSCPGGRIDRVGSAGRFEGRSREGFAGLSFETDGGFARGSVTRFVTAGPMLWSHPWPSDRGVQCHAWAALSIRGTPRQPS